MRAIPAVAAAGVLAACALLWYGHANAAPFMDAPTTESCAFFYSDNTVAGGREYVRLTGDVPIESAPKEIRRRTATEWVVILYSKPVSMTYVDLRTGVKRVVPLPSEPVSGASLGGLPVVTDPTEIQSATVACDL